MTAGRLFDAGQRRDRSLARPGEEDTISFLNRVDDTYFGRVRAAVESWYAAWPPEQADALRGALRSTRQRQAMAAWWELYVHATCAAAGYSPEVEPASLDATVRDLRVAVPCRRGVAATVLVEDTYVGDPAESRSEDAIVEQFIAHLNRLAPNGFWLGLDIVSRGPDAPKASAVRRAIKTWMDGLDPATVTSDLERGGEAPETIVQAGDWAFRFRALPRSAEAIRLARPGDRLIGIGPTKSAWGGSEQTLRNRLTTKAARYERTDEPYVIAVMNNHSFATDDDLLDVLYGPEQVHFTELPSGELHPTGTSRGNDRLWRPDKNTSVSAVLYASRFMPWSIASAAPELWINPWAEHPIPADAFDWCDRVQADSVGVLERIPAGRPITELLGLSAEWPGPEKPFERSEQVDASDT